MVAAAFDHKRFRMEERSRRASSVLAPCNLLLLDPCWRIPCKTELSF
jgi:hypothetical protein